MAKTRRGHRKGHRKSRRAHRKGKGSRKTHGGGLFRTLYSPVSHLLQATGNTASAVTNTTRNVVRRGLRGVNSVGKSVTGHANSAVTNLVGKGRRRRSTRRNRRN
jgi:hypothetical protein